jgi:broad specificity phosphatase PhoE
MDGAAILAAHLGIGYKTVEALGEIDRSATGYLPKKEHDAAANLLFRQPEESVRGWERAVDAQQRMIAAMETLLMNDLGGEDTVVVTHGAVATLYLCHLKGRPISKDEAPPGAHGGDYYCFDAQTRSLVHGWRPVDG